MGVYTLDRRNDVLGSLPAFQQRPRGVVIRDMCLNGVSGLDVLRELREWNRDMCVVLVSGHDELHEEMHTAVGRGAASCLTKPLDLNVLLTTIGALA